MRLGLAQAEQPFTVPLMRLAQFIRQSGLLPKLLSRLISHMHKVLRGGAPANHTAFTREALSNGIERPKPGAACL